MQGRKRIALTMKRVATVCVAGVLLCLCVSSCASREPGGKAGAWAVEKTTDRGPVRVVLRIDKDEITIAQQIHLELFASAEEGYTVEFPKFGDKLEQFGIIDFTDAPPALSADERVERTRTYVLEPFLSGEYVIPSMTVGFKKEGEEQPVEVQTEEAKITVTSLLPEEVAELAIADIAGPAPLPRKTQWGMPALILGLIVVLAAAAAFEVYRRGRKRTQEAEQEPPHEAAYRALEALLADDLIEKGLIKEFYVRISDILRRFLEARYDLHAPEQTTEEFLRNPATEAVLPRDARHTLRAFLQHCDLVKFAEHQPDAQDIQNAFDTCKDFILNTPPDSEDTAQTAGGSV